MKDKITTLLYTWYWKYTKYGIHKIQ